MFWVFFGEYSLFTPFYSNPYSMDQSGSQPQLLLALHWLNPVHSLLVPAPGPPLGLWLTTTPHTHNPHTHHHLLKSILNWQNWLKTSLFYSFWRAKCCAFWSGGRSWHTPRGWLAQPPPPTHPPTTYSHPCSMDQSGSQPQLLLTLHWLNPVHSLLVPAPGPPPKDWLAQHTHHF